MGIIKGVLREELENSIRLKKDYEKSVKSHRVAFREGKKVKFIYKGKELSKEYIAELEKEKQLRVKYKKLIQKLNKRIRYLRKALHGKEDV